LRLVIDIGPKVGRDGHTYWQLSLDGREIGPALWDLNTAQVIKQWLVISRGSIEQAFVRGRIEWTFEQALGFGMKGRARQLEGGDRPALPGPGTIAESEVAR